MAAGSTMADKGPLSAEKLLATWTIPVLIALLEGLTHFGIWYGDSNGYVSILKLFRGTASMDEAKVIGWHGIVRPVVPLLALPFSYMMSYRDAVASVSLGFFLVGTLFAYLFAKRLLNSRAGFISAVFFASSLPNVLFGASVLTDGPAYTMEVIVLYFLLFSMEAKRALRTSLLGGALIGVAVLTKETNFVILVFLLLRFFLHRDRMPIRSMVPAAIVGLAIPLVWSQLVGYNYLGFYGEGLAYKTLGYKGPLVQPGPFAVSAVYAFGPCLPFAFIGFLAVDDDRFKTFCEMLLSVGVLLALWPTAPEYRFTFLTFPAVLPLAAVGTGQALGVLSGKPWFNRLNETRWLALFLLATVALTNLATFGRYFRTPFGA